MAQHSRIIYFEIPANNPARCMDFYRQVFNWEFSALDDGDTWLVRTGPDELPGINGSIKAVSGQQNVVNTMAVPSIQQTHEAIELHGGKVILPRKALPGFGWLLYFEDTEGNLHGALQPHVFTQ